MIADQDFLQSNKMVEIKKEPLYTPRPLRVVCVGAGFGGLLVAHQVKYNKQFEGFINFQIYEKNTSVGGTWFENRYGSSL